MSEERNDTTRRSHWLDEPKNVKKVVHALFIACGILFIADAFYAKKSHFAIEDLFGFYALYSFVVCVALVFAAKVIRLILMRDEDYYDRD